MDKVSDKTTGFHFTIVDNYVLDEKQLNGNEQIVYIHLKRYSNSNAECFPGISKMATKLGWTEKTVRNHLRNLEKKGFITIEPRFENNKQQSNLYTLLPYPEYIEEQEAKGQVTVDKPMGIAEVLNCYQNNINPIYGSMERNKLIKLFEDFEDNPEIIIKAIEIAVEQNVRKLRYIESILIDWHQRGIKSIEQAEAYTKQRKGGDKGGGPKEDNAEEQRLKSQGIGL
jgi:DnaD/phage-associated family protein